MKALIPEGVNESKIIWLNKPKNIENANIVKLIFKGGINPILIAIINAAIANRNIGYNLILRNNNAKAMIRINKNIKFVEFVKSKLQDDNPIPRNKNNDKRIVMRNAPKIE